jgi:hypothetical protein
MIFKTLVINLKEVAARLIMESGSDGDKFRT